MTRDVIATGSVYGWGKEYCGHEISNNEKASTMKPKLISTFQHERAVQVSCGLEHTAVLLGNYHTDAYAHTYPRAHIEKQAQSLLSCCNVCI